MGKRVVIDEEECIGCGNCEGICPEVFKVNTKAEKSIVIKPEGGQEELIQEAMLECPMSCIFWD
jgi:ferredoxin